MLAQRWPNGNTFSLASFQECWLLDGRSMCYCFTNLLIWGFSPKISPSTDALASNATWLLMPVGTMQLRHVCQEQMSPSCLWHPHLSHLRRGAAKEARKNCSVLVATGPRADPFQVFNSLSSPGVSPVLQPCESVAAQTT